MVIISICFFQRNKVVSMSVDWLALQTEIHSENVKAGWWDNPRSMATLCNLFHSELSEAMEGVRKNLPDDKLPHHEMFKVEIADYVIRVLDYLGYVGCDWVSVHSDYLHFTDRNAFINHQHNCVSNFNMCKDTDCLCYSLKICLNQADSEGWSLIAIMDEKRQFNRTREDHKRENRQLENGKKF